MNPDGTDGVIRITREEATSSHVDDLLKRQRSLRGEPGVTREQGRSWYYQNWFVFMLLGLLGAALAWAILEPYFDDMEYWQGPISRVDAAPTPTTRPATDDRAVAFTELIQGTIVVREQQIYLLAGLQELRPEGGRRLLQASELTVGETIGVYLRYQGGIALGHFVVRSPPPQAPDVAKLSLADLGRRSQIAGLLLFAVVAGCIGLFIGAVDGLVCRLPRRALLCGAVGLLVGLVGGLVSSILANIVYAPLSEVALSKMREGSGVTSALGFGLQVLGRSFAWGLAGLAMGLGQGIALRSRRLLLYGLLGGIMGGLLGGLLFDPIDFMLLGADKPSAHLSRLVGFCAIGASVGGFIGLVELLARDAWLRMTQGPLAGKEFLLFKELMAVGASPRSDIYLFNDPQVAPDHALIRVVGNECDIEARDRAHGIQVNDRSVQRARLRHGDRVTIGRTVFVFQRRKG